MEFTKEQIDRIDAEFKRWQEFLNYTLGIFACNSALACLSLKSPTIFGWCALVFFGFVGYIGAHKFPESFKQLREKKQKTQQEEIWYLGLNSKHLGITQILRKYPVYLLGLLFLGLVATGFVKNW